MTKMYTSPNARVTQTSKCTHHLTHMSDMTKMYTSPNARVTHD